MLSCKLCWRTKRPASGDDEVLMKAREAICKSLDALEDQLAVALKSLEADYNTVGSIVSWPWIMASFLTSLVN